MNNESVIKVLRSLYKISKAAERGMRTASENVSNRGLKVILKNFAQERRDAALALRSEIEAMNGSIGDRDSIMGLLGLIHRGRIAIVATMTLGKTNTENLVIRETLWGDRFALNAYERVLSQNLPAHIKEMVASQHAQLLTSRELIERLQGEGSNRSLVRLFDSEKDLQNATTALRDAGYSISSIDFEPVEKYVQKPYQGRGTPMREAVLSGAVGGAIWGTLLGVIVGAAGYAGELMGSTYSMQSIMAIFALTSMLSGAGVGAFLGMFIGAGISEEDALLYADGVNNGQVLAIMQTDRSHATAMSKIMYAVNVASRAQAQQTAEVV